MQITNPGTLPPDPALSQLRFDFSGNQPWLAGVAVSCERCGFGKTLGDGASVGDSGDARFGLHAAYHFVYKDNSAPGWGYGVYVCPCCGKYLFLERELPVVKLH